MASRRPPRTTPAASASVRRWPARSRSRRASNGRSTSMSVTRALPLVLCAGAAFAQETQPAADKLERPQLLEDAAPRYPEAAWKAQKEADVVVLLTVAEDGSVSEAEVVGPAGEGFDEEALLAARKLRFSPARLNGVPTAVKIRYTFRFRVPEKETVAKQPPACAEAT